MANFESELSAYVREGADARAKVYHSTSAEAEAINSVYLECGDFDGVVALSYSTEGAPNFHQNVQAIKPLLRGIIAYNLYRYGPSTSAITSHRQAVAELRKQLKGTINNFDEDQKRYGEEWAGHEQRFNDLVAACGTQIENFITASEAAKKEIEDKYETAMSLDAPTQYWVDKRKKHRQGTIVAAVLFVVYIVAVYCAVEPVLAEDKIGVFDTTKWEKSPFGLAAIIAVSVGIIMAGARIFYRQFVSQLHLYNDADERHTMVKAYLALAAKGHAKEEFMEALINRLFTPASDGLVSDDIGPITFLDTVKRWSDKSGS